MKYPEAILRSITEDILSDFLGREILPGDPGALEALVAATKEDGDRIRLWLRDLTLTDPFRDRRNAHSRNL